MKHSYVLGTVAALCAVAIVTAVINRSTVPDAPQPHAKCSFPDTVRQGAGSMQLYCIDERPLPSGMRGGSRTATYGQGAVVYSLRDNNSPISVSLQKKPSEKELANFVTNLIPLHLEFDTPVGKASMGVHSGQTLISLPTNNSTTWILITAPAEYDPDRAATLLKHIVTD